MAKGSTGAAPPAALDVLGRPELVIFAGAGDQDAPPRLAMRYTAEDSRTLGKWRFVADASSGDILDTVSLVQAANVWGRDRRATQN